MHSKKAYSIAVVDTTSSSAKIRTLTVAQRVRIQRTTPNIILSNVNSGDEVSLRPKVKIPTAAQTEIQLTNRFHSDRSCGHGFKSFQVAFFRALETNGNRYSCKKQLNNTKRNEETQEKAAVEDEAKSAFCDSQSK